MRQISAIAAIERIFTDDVVDAAAHLASDAAACGDPPDDISIVTTAILMLNALRSRGEIYGVAPPGPAPTIDAEFQAVVDALEARADRLYALNQRRETAKRNLSAETNDQAGGP